MTNIPNFDRMMDLIVVTVVDKKFFFFKKKHEVYVLYTPSIKRIHKINPTGYKKFPFQVGDNANDVMKWAKKNNYKYRTRRGKKNNLFK